MPLLQDSHIHLQDAGDAAPEILAGARAHDVGRFFCNSISPENWTSLKEIADQDERVIPFYGVHPWYVDKAAPGWEEELSGLLTDPRACIGEIGLDRVHNHGVDFDLQRKIFSRQLDIAVSLGKRFNVHCVRAWDVLLDELRLRAKLLPGFIVHSFSGLPGIALELIKYGAYISFSSRLMDESAFRHRATFGQIPLDRVFLETDYPYTYSVRSGGEVSAENYFKEISTLYKSAASLKCMDEKEMVKRIWDNGTIFLH